jgi:hypothetical protein
VSIHKHNSRVGWLCAPENSRRAKVWREANPERAAATKQTYRENLGDEAFLAMRRAASARYSEAHRQEIRDKANAERERLRAAAIEAYGGHCNCPGCHVVHAVLLTVDHIKGDGAEHRRKMGRSTRDFYRWLEKNGYPSDYQLLCGSCNLAKADKDKCPLAGQEH